ncbi:PadR family transcriptional regulator [Edaphobacter bradus]|uniref:PadR family transcriptional regulator n=1 Tax=Edaphobacter bradus TaxID=2259016 RepID=UPI0021DFD563|nr:PadR family transcriptional regulator [Edaphobacter bradus]
MLDIFILSLLDRGYETTYHLQRQAGLSLGSTVPALRRLEARRLITRQETLTLGARPKHSFALTPAGKKLARSGWKPLFDPGRADDLDAILRIAEMARANGVESAEIREFLERSSRTRLEAARTQGDSLAADEPQKYVTTRSRWNRARLEAEAKFLAGLAEEYKKVAKRRR